MATFDPAKFRAAMEKAPDALAKQLYDKVGKFTLWFAQKHMARTMNLRLKRRSGDLARSFNATSAGDKLENLRWIIYTTSPYAAAQEFGADIEPVSAKALTVPLNAAMTRTGRKRGKARSFENTFVQRAKNGKLFIFQRYGRGGKKIRPLFRLMDKVTIPPRLEFFKTWQDQNDALMAKVAQAVDAALDSMAP